jgi:hypothetical protein
MIIVLHYSEFNDKAVPNLQDHYNHISIAIVHGTKRKYGNCIRVTSIYSVVCCICTGINYS